MHGTSAIWLSEEDLNNGNTNEQGMEGQISQDPSPVVDKELQASDKC